MKRMWTKKSIGETAVESVNAGISSGVIVIPDEVYEYTLSTAETADLLTGLGGASAFQVGLGIDYTEALKHPAIRLVAEADVDLDHIKLEALLVEIAQAYANGTLARFSYQSARPMGLTASQFDLNLVVVDGNPILDAAPHESGGGGELYCHLVSTGSGSLYQFFTSSAVKLTLPEIITFIKGSGASNYYPLPSITHPYNAKDYLDTSGTNGIVYKTYGLFVDGSSLKEISRRSTITLSTDGSAVTTSQSTTTATNTISTIYYYIDPFLITIQ